MNNLLHKHKVMTFSQIRVIHSSHKKDVALSCDVEKANRRALMEHIKLQKDLKAISLARRQTELLGAEVAEES